MSGKDGWVGYTQDCFLDKVWVFQVCYNVIQTNEYPYNIYRFVEQSVPQMPV